MASCACLAKFWPQRFQVRVFQCHEFDLVGVTQRTGFLQPRSGRVQIAQLAFIAREVVGDGLFPGKCPSGLNQNCPGLGNAAAGFASHRIRQRNPHARPVRFQFSERAGNFRRRIPFPSLGANVISDDEHVWMGTELRCNLVQLRPGLRNVAQFQPAYGG